MDKNMPKADEVQGNERSNILSYSPSSASSGGGVPSQRQGRSPNLVPQHQRNVSWGLNEVLNLGLPPPASRQRSDTSNLSASFKPRTQGSTVDRPPNIPKPEDTATTFLSQPTKSSTIALPDGKGIVNPLEAEAESYLIRAIERAANEVEAPILQNIPDEAIGHHSAAEDFESLDSAEREATSENKRHRRIRSSFTSQTINTKTPTAASQTAMGSPPRPQFQNKHMRKPTLDQQLFGLTHAIETLHAENNAPYQDEILPEPPRPRSRTNTLDTNGAAPVETIDEEFAQPPASSYDTLANNAEILFQQVHQGELGRFQSFRRRPRTDSNVNHSHHSSPIIEIELEDQQNQDEEIGLSPTANMTDENAQSGNSQDDDDPKIRPGTAGSNTTPGRKSSTLSKAMSIMFDEWGFTSDIKNFLRPKRNMIYLFLQMAILYIAIPALATAAILFYLVDNPPTGRLAHNGEEVDGKLINTDGNEVDPNVTSISYYLLFVGVRQMTTLILALGSQLFLIDFLAIDRGYLFKFGARLPLFIMQARGWPFVLFFWSMFDWALLSGKHPFFSHWLHFQNAISLFNASNPDGGFVASEWNHRVLGLATGVSFAVAVKRFWMGIFLGKQTYYQFSDKLASAMRKMLLVSQVAALSRQIVSAQGRKQLLTREATIMSALTEEKIGGLMDSAEDDTSNANADDSVAFTVAGSEAKGAAVIDPNDRSPFTGKLSGTQKNRISRLLGAWEEPNELAQTNEPISILSLMHFRRAMSSVRTDFPFSASFGPAGTREDCITSAQDVYRRLVLLSEYEDVLNFEVLALLGAKSDGSLDHDKLMELIKLFRPDRDGSLSMVHFVRSVDKVYKEIRMLRASVSNSSKVDGQFEAVFDVVFYTLVVVVALYALGIDPLSLFVSLSGLAVSISFMIGTASANYFQGLLFILVRRPYAIGDCIHVSDSNTDTSSKGSGFWTVEDITLFSTQVRYSFTNERASLSNGALASSRIINSSKSHNAGLYHFLKFPIDVPNEKVKLFHEAIESFVRNRPREWIALDTFRATTVNADLGYIQYIVAVTHRESWASWVQIHTSQSDLMRFGVELAKKLDIVYRQPTLPVDIQTPSSQSQVLAGRVQADTQQAPPANVNMPVLSPQLSGSHPLTGTQNVSDYSVDFQNIAAQFPPRASSRAD